jgi:hypothetical protein
MRSMTWVAGAVVLAVAAASCSGGTNPVSPTAATQSAVAGSSGTPAAGTPTGTSTTPIGLTGVIRGLNSGAGTFSLVTRAGTRVILTDGETQVWRSGTQIRVSSLRDGQSVSVRGYDYTRYVLARTIGVN